MRISQIGLLAILSSSLLFVQQAQAAPATAPVAAEPLPEKDGLKVSIVPTTEQGEVGMIDFKMPDPFIAVELRNSSDKPINVFDEWDSWGAYDLTLEIKEVDGKVLDKPLSVIKGPMMWLANFSSSEEIAPGKAVIRHVRLRTPLRMLSPSLPDRDQDLNPPQGPIYWKFPVPLKGQTHAVTMRAVFANDDPISGIGRGKKTVWTGRIASPWKKYTVSWATDEPQPNSNPSEKSGR